MTCDPNDNAPHTVEQWFNTSCFVRRPVADTGTRPGNAGRNTVRGPGFARTDLSLFKNIDMPRDHTACSCASRRSTCSTRRASASPASRSAPPNFGRITSADDGRIIQLAAKYSF